MITKDKLLSAGKRMRNDFKKWMPGIIAASIFLFIMLFFFRSVCLSRVLFGLPCPACGLTRAAFLLIQGDIAGSIRMHPLLLFTVAGALLYAYEVYLLDRKPRWSVCYLVVLLAAFFVVYSVRMYLYFPDAEPMNVYRNSFLSKFIEYSHH